MTVIQTGAIAAVAYVFGDYASEIVRLGENSSALYGALAVVALTALNFAGTLESKRLQVALQYLLFAGLVFLGIAGLVVGAPAEKAAAAPGGAAGTFGLAMIFVLLTFGGWNEAAYVSAELRDVRHNMVRALIIALAVITLLYLLVNLAYLHVLGLEGMRATEVIATDTMRAAVGNAGAGLVAALIVVAVLTSMNVSILTGARTNYALGRDFHLFRYLGAWNGETNAPSRALVVQGAIALLLVLIGAFSRSGFETMVHYVSPVFWLFFLLTALSLFVLRRREPARPRPFRVPLYPLTPLVFSAMCAYMLYSSLAYTGFGALLGVLVLAAGAPLLLLLSRNR
jgi:amino acid transporter